MLAAALEPGTIRYGVSATAEPDGYDVVVAADGLRSATRASWPGDPGVRYSGYSTWRGVTSRAVDVGGAAGETVGRGERFGMAPLADGRVYWFGVASMPSDDAGGSGGGAGFYGEVGEVRGLARAYRRSA
ncbi:hypothetical protein [Actinoplanes sp. NBRC 103695]|uniref:hypothetical protein n=1 Tax=Actinoplanes sp. NBRC 103695 TaxID=3032202 RepID=UPI0024A1C558|nr:hypothetical protein [Actinoplanes sp. NBRC 103695]GLZ01671.1 hypothetical protein Acsp02_89220 [Actinoplanes sp. NBRC 103695]